MAAKRTMLWLLVWRALRLRFQRVSVVFAALMVGATIVTALLHDTIEDTETTEQELVRLFGQEVTAIVLEVTDDKALPKAERKRLQIENAPDISRRAKLVKLLCR